MRHSFSLHRLTGAPEPRRRFTLSGRQFFQHRLSGVLELRKRIRPFPGGRFFAEIQRGNAPSADGGNVPRPAAGQEGRHQGFYPLNSHFLLGGSGADCRHVTAAKWGTAVGLPQRVFLRLFAVHRQRTAATHTVYSTQARHKVNCPKGKRRSPEGYPCRATRLLVITDGTYEFHLFVNS